MYHLPVQVSLTVISKNFCQKEQQFWPDHKITVTKKKVITTFRQVSAEADFNSVE
jgi:hypothetical protein